jgi:ribosomal-protein-alanine N-acetyltransferase
VKAPEILRTTRLLLRRPDAADVTSIYDRYASDPEVCRYLAWPMHRSVDDTLGFLEFSDTEWRHWPAGPFLIFSRSGDKLLGSTGLAFENSSRASTGYVFARDSWGCGLATEVVLAMKSLAASLGVKGLYAHVFPDHVPSRRVLEKAGFLYDGTLAEEFLFPNLDPKKMFNVVSYSCRPDQ